MPKRQLLLRIVLILDIAFSLSWAGFALIDTGWLMGFVRIVAQSKVEATPIIHYFTAILGAYVLFYSSVLIWAFRNSRQAHTVLVLISGLNIVRAIQRAFWTSYLLETFKTPVWLNIINVIWLLTCASVYLFCRGNRPSDDTVEH